MKLGSSMSATPVPQANEHIGSVRIQQRTCFVDNVTSWTKQSLAWYWCCNDCDWSL